jgi:hypothetical protein
MENNNNAQENQVNIELSEDMAMGIYSNLSIITHSNTEFVCDFIQMMPGMPKGKVRSRVIMTPDNAKRFMRALIENVQKFEQAFGNIPDIEPAHGNNGPMNFGTPTTQA